MLIAGDVSSVQAAVAAGSKAAAEDGMLVDGRDSRSIRGTLPGLHLEPAHTFVGLAPGINFFIRWILNSHRLYQ